MLDPSSPPQPPRDGTAAAGVEAAGPGGVGRTVVGPGAVVVGGRSMRRQMNGIVVDEIDDVDVVVVAPVQAAGLRRSAIELAIGPDGGYGNGPPVT